MFSKKIINNEIYNDFASGWWDSDSFLNILETCIQPVRAEYISNCMSPYSDLNDLNFLDIGCGGGILTEYLASLSNNVTGIDASSASLNTAALHAKQQDLDITYTHAYAENLPFENNSFDVITCCDVLEHVDDLDKVIGEISRVLRPGGSFIYDTVNRTVMSYLALIVVAQDFPWTRFAPKNAHVWNKFIRPKELAAHLSFHGLISKNEIGMEPSVNPLMMLYYILQVKKNKIDFATFGEKTQFVLTESKAISYLGYCVKG